MRVAGILTVIIITPGKIYTGRHLILACKPMMVYSFHLVDEKFIRLIILRILFHLTVVSVEKKKKTLFSVLKRSFFQEGFL